MDFLLNPNVAYLLLAGGLVFAVLAILSPGTGLLEVIALFTLLLSGWTIYSLPVNFWALFILAVGVVLFILSIWKARQYWLLAAAIGLLVVGSAFLFRGETWWQPAVNPFLAATVSILSGGFFWIASRKVIEAESERPSHDLGVLVGAVGEARSDIHEEGSVQVGGELWSAHSRHPIADGSLVKVIGREGFILEVEPEETQD